LFIGQSDSRKIDLIVEPGELRRIDPDIPDADQSPSGPPIVTVRRYDVSASDGERPMSQMSQIYERYRRRMELICDADQNALCKHRRELA